MKRIVFITFILFAAGLGHAQDIVIERDQVFCLRDDLEQQYRGCTATKFPGRFYYTANCPNLDNPDKADDEILITEEWAVVFEGEPGCDALITERSDIPYYLPRSEIERNDAPVPEVKSATVVRLLYGTNRQVATESNRITYTGERGDKLHLGSMAISVPAERSVGSINRPWSLRIPWSKISIEFTEDSTRHFAVRWIGGLSYGLFLEQLRDAVGNYKTNVPKQAFVFVHGFNTSFDAAAFRTAQLAHDMKFPGAPIFFSWPSRDNTKDYEYDQQSARSARSFLADFLALIRDQSGADIVHLVAHSMGNDPLLEALRDLKQQTAADKPLFNEVILAAPDIDLNLFVQLAAQVSGVARGFTLYANKNDLALNFSKKFAGGVRRAGDLPPVIVRGIDTIDISKVGSDLFSLNHSTYADSAMLLNDIGRLFLAGEQPDDRPFLRRIERENGHYWQMPVD